MFIYNAKVRLLGSLNNEVVRKNVTPAEIAILQRMHGRDAVVDVVKAGEVFKRTDRSERNRLAQIYQIGPSADGKTRLSGESFIDSVLGVGNPLPKEYVAPVELDAKEAEPQEQEEIVLDTDEPIVRTKIEAPPKASAQTAIDDLLESTET